MPIDNAVLTQQLHLALAPRLPICPTWLNTFISTLRPPIPPLPVLASTAHFRALASDIAVSLSHTPALPRDIADVNTKERKLVSDVVVQVLDVSDVGASKHAQIEALERAERGEEVRGREVIRTLPAEQTGEVPAVAAKSSGPDTYILQDAAGTEVTAFERGKVPRMGLGDGECCCIGMKVLLRRGAVVRRGRLMLESAVVQVLGGKVEAWDKAWREGRKERLKRELDAESQQEVQS